VIALCQVFTREIAQLARLLGVLFEDEFRRALL
jgi:hypothetical protein